MAWNVRENLLSFGLEVYMMTQEEKIVKRRYIDERYNQQMLRVDLEEPVEPLHYDMPKDHFDVLVISDYDKGFLSTERIFELVKWFDGPVFIDSKKTTLPVNDAFIKINEDEYNKLDDKTGNCLLYTSPSPRD